MSELPGQSRSLSGFSPPLSGVAKLAITQTATMTRDVVRKIRRATWLCHSCTKPLSAALLRQGVAGKGCKPGLSSFPCEFRRRHVRRGSQQGSATKRFRVIEECVNRRSSKTFLGRTASFQTISPTHTARASAGENLRNAPFKRARFSVTASVAMRGASTAGRTDEVARQRAWANASRSSGCAGRI